MNKERLIEDLKETAKTGRMDNMRQDLKSVISDLEQGKYNLED